MFLLAATAAFVGFVHSLAPAHWIPVSLIAKSRKWSRSRLVLGAVAASTGHIVTSTVLSVAVIAFGAHYLHEIGEDLEFYSGMFLAGFGLLYAVYAYFRFARGHGHHHAHSVKKDASHPFLMLFVLGLSPCMTVVPVFTAAAPMGISAIVFSGVAFIAGVLTALIGTTLLASFGLMKFEHPVLDRYGEVIAGLGITVGGLLLLLFHSHAHEHV